MSTASLPRSSVIEIRGLLAAAIGLPLLQTPLQFDGGNVLVGNAYTLIGTDSVAASEAALAAGGADLASLVQRWFGTRT